MIRKSIETNNVETKAIEKSIETNNVRTKSIANEVRYTGKVNTVEEFPYDYLAAILYQLVSELTVSRTTKEGTSHEAATAAEHRAG